MRLVERVRQTIRRYQLVQSGDQVLVGVSGGPDSLTLLYLLAELAPQLGITLHVFHLNHLLRGEEAEADEDFVRETARLLELPITVRRYNVAAFQQEKGMSLEEAARAVRYQFLFAAARETGSQRIALGHHRDDQVETILLNLFRGTGLEGLVGMPILRPVAAWEEGRWTEELGPQRDSSGDLPEGVEPAAAAGTARGAGDYVPELWLIRPLLEISRTEIEAYCQERGLKPRRDPSNWDRRFRRNRVRLELLPALERDYNPQIRQTLAQMAENLRLDYELITTLARERLAELARPLSGEPGLALSLAELQACPASLRRWVLRLALEKVRGSSAGVGLSHLRTLEELILSPAGGRQAHLPGVRAYRDHRQLTLVVAAAVTTSGEKGENCTLPVPGRVELPSHQLSIVAEVVNLEKSGAAWAKRLGQPESCNRSETEQPLSPPPSSAGEPACRLEELFGWGRPGEWEAWLDAEGLSLPLTVRLRRPGDRFWPLGWPGPVKLKDFLIGQKIPRRWRDRLLLVQAGEEIVWIPGLRLSEAHKLKEDSRQAVHLSCHFQGEEG